MTFEVYRKRWPGGFTVAAKAVTQDPASVRDYIKQTSAGRWVCGRRTPHGLHLDLLSAMPACSCSNCDRQPELLALPAVLTVWPCRPLPAVRWHAAAVAHSAVAGHLSLRAISLGVLALTCCLPGRGRRRARPKYLLYVRSSCSLRRSTRRSPSTRCRVLREKSTGRWVSPARRAPVGGAVPRPAGEAAERQAEPPVWFPRRARFPRRSRWPPRRVGPVPYRASVPISSTRLDWRGPYVVDQDGSDAETNRAQNGEVISEPRHAEPDRRGWTRSRPSGPGRLKRFRRGANNLGVLLATELDRPLRERRMWWTRAARAVP